VQASDAGTYLVTVTNAQDDDISEPSLLTINAPLSIPGAVLPTGSIGDPYTANLTAIGGVGTRTWVLDSGVLPADLSIATDGEITGTPVTAARADITVRVTDDSGTTTQTFQINIAP
jgi:hypothetical protein